MCTAITYSTLNHYFGRNLDLEFSYIETVTITPRNYPFKFHDLKPIEQHYAIIGMAYVVDDYPLYYDAINEKGLGMAGLNFPKNAVYKDDIPGMTNLASFEFIPYILSTCENIQEAKALLKKINITKTNFSEELQAATLHWIIADKQSSITVECVKDGLKVYDNPVGVLTNNPPFDFQLFNLNNYMNITSDVPENHFSPKIDLEVYSRGMGGLGLPGDLSSLSRFVKATFIKLNSKSQSDENASVSQFFHILNSVEQQNGCALVADDKYEMTIYSSCMNMEECIYYYRMYNNSQISAVKLFNENLDGSELISYKLIADQQVNYQN